MLACSPRGRRPSSLQEESCTARPESHSKLQQDREQRTLLLDVTALLRSFSVSSKLLARLAERGSLSYTSSGPWQGGRARALWLIDCASPLHCADSIAHTRRNSTYSHRTGSPPLPRRSTAILEVQLAVRAPDSTTTASPQRLGTVYRRNAGRRSPSTARKLHFSSILPLSITTAYRSFHLLRERVGHSSRSLTISPPRKPKDGTPY